MPSTKIPTELRQVAQWINWKLLPGEDAPRKVPIAHDGRPASTTDPDTWCDYETALQSAPRSSGLGFVFSADDPFCGIDFDGCRNPETQEVSPWAKNWIARLNSYSEVSPSLTGVKVWIKGSLPFASGKKTCVRGVESAGGKQAGVEAYDHARYFCVTGLRISGLPHEPQERQAELDALCQEFFKSEDKPGFSGPDRSSRLSVVERARRYVATLPGAYSGQGGHNATFHAACVLVLGFSLTKAESLILLSEYNQRCEPKWTEKELRHKIESADKQPGERGYLANANDSEWPSITIPDYHQPAPAAKPGRSEPSTSTLQGAASLYLDKISSSTGAALISTGLQTVDYAIGGGMEFGEMVIVAARPSHGKSAFALHALDASARIGIPCAIISEEMSALSLGKRTVQYVSEWPEHTWVAGAERVRADLDRHFASRAPCYIVEGCGSAERASDAVRNLVSRNGVKVVAVDYAQLLSSAGKSRYEQITQTSITMRHLASTTQVTLMVLCQLSRTIEHRDKFIPRLEDLKDSGQLEQDADVILFLVWPYRLDTKRHPSQYEVWIGKNRNRPINAPEVDCQFDPSRQNFLVGHADPTGVHYEPRWRGQRD